MSIEVLRAHYGMAGIMPDPKPSMQKFEQAFGTALQTKSVSDFHDLAPLLIINFWDRKDLVDATPTVHRGRLRFLGAVAMFLVDFNPTTMPWPGRLQLKLEKLDKELNTCNMAFDAFTGDMDFPGCERPGFFRPYKLAISWKLAHFWEGCAATLRQNHEMLALFKRADPQLDPEDDSPLQRDLVGIMHLPLGERMRELKEFVEAH
jgi:hypothetical protein